VYWSNLISFWDDLLDPLLVTFDGDNKYIIVNPIVQYANGTPVGSSVTVRAKQDIYSASKRWLQRRQNLDYLPPMRTIGGDSVGSGQYAGDIYFVTNGYQIYVTNQVNITGIVYNDNVGTSPYAVQAGGGVIATVSSLAYAYTTSGVTVPTADQTAAAVWAVNPNAYAGNTNTLAGTLSQINSTTTNILAVTS
jgi:hypothetical protein